MSSPGRNPEAVVEAPPAPLRRTYVVLVRPQGPINVGLTCRAAANMGAAGVRVVAPGPRALTPSQTRPFACHALDVLEGLQIFPALAPALEDVDFAVATTRRVRRGPHQVYSLAEAGESIVAAPRAAAVVFGSEADGLNGDEVACCDATIALSLPGQQPSLNLSHAVAVVLWSLQQHLPQAPPLGREVAATSSQRRGLLRLWEEALRETGYFLRTDQERFLTKLRAMCQNLAVTGRDTQLLSGMLRHFQRSAAPPGERRGNDAVRARRDGNAEGP